MSQDANRQHIAALRREYQSRELHEHAVAADPMSQFQVWFDESLQAELHEPNAMHLSTSMEGQPTSRIVLLKDFDDRGLVFYTNYSSRKGEEIAANPLVCALFYWGPLERQVRIEGPARKVSVEESEAYFRSRPRGSQIGAWASPQSQVIPSRDALQASQDEYEAKFAGGEVPLPPFWGGYRIEPTYVEFWQGGGNRLHDRLLYELGSEGWSLKRLSA